MARMSDDILIVLIFLLINASGSAALNAAERQAILDCHNAYRSQLAKGIVASKNGLMPVGSNIVQLQYDTGIEAIAQNLANQCTFSGSPNRQGMNQNLYVFSTPNMDKTSALQQTCKAWWNELQRHVIQPNLQLAATEFSSWSQMAWSSTVKIGCAVADCPNSQWKTYVVCNYSPSGNIIGQSVYQRGTPCSACGPGATCNATNGLCISGTLSTDPAPLNAVEQQVILDCHNAFRSQLAKGTAANKTGLMPSGSNLIQLQYDKGIEAIAQDWANQCKMAHSSSTHRPGMGENLFWSTIIDMAKTLALQQACEGWWNELKQFGIQPSLQLTTFELGKGIGHWSQMAWAKTAKIGCGVGNCPNSYWKTYVVCNYSPAGNIIDQEIYQKGIACSACGAGESCNHTNGLCIVAK